MDVLGYVKAPSHGLVMFCNPEHPYVSNYLRELSDNIQTIPNKKKKTRGGQKAKLFQSVRKYVMDAIRDLRLFEDKNLNHNHVRRVTMEGDLPECFEEIYNDLLEKGGGVILLERPRWKRRTASGAYNQKWTSWEISLDDLKKKIAQEKRAKINIWEYQYVDFLVVTVPGEKSRVVVPLIDPNQLF